MEVPVQLVYYLFFRLLCFVALGGNRPTTSPAGRQSGGRRCSEMAHVQNRMPQGQP